MYLTSITILYDLNGTTLLPGFIDSHSHFISTSLISSFASLFPPPDGIVDSFQKISAKMKEWISLN